MVGIDDQGRNSCRFKMRKYALPIDSRALHHDLLDPLLQQPANQCSHIALEAAKLTRLARYDAVLLDQNRYNVLHPVHVYAGNSLMDYFHWGSPSSKIQLREASD